MLLPPTSLTSRPPLLKVANPTTAAVTSAHLVPTFVNETSAI